jgi:hypothetical protein
VVLELLLLNKGFYRKELVFLKVRRGNAVQTLLEVSQIDLLLEMVYLWLSQIDLRLEMVHLLEVPQIDLRLEMVYLLEVPQMDDLVEMLLKWPQTRLVEVPYLLSKKQVAEGIDLPAIGKSAKREAAPSFVIELARLDGRDPLVVVNINESASFSSV